MNERPAPQNDLLDVEEMAEKLDRYMRSILEDNDKNLAISALMSATINSIISQCSTMNEIVFYRNLLMQFFDTSIKAIQISGPEKPSSSS